jgi:NAD-dependent deacetylase
VRHALTAGAGGRPVNSFDVERAAKLLASARSICVSTGAGMSAESGVPTFRDGDGLWSRFRPEELASPEAFARDPHTVWSWYRWRRAELGRVQPHAGHAVLAGWEARWREFIVVTQNVDGLHHRAGSKRVLELHGRLDRARCTACDYETLGLDDLGEDPRCPRCRERLRPGVVWFGEMLPAGALEAATDAARTCAAMLVIGTSGVVQPAASLVMLARGAGARIVEINPRSTPLSALAHVSLRAACGAALTAIDAVIRGSSAGASGNL